MCGGIISFFDGPGIFLAYKNWGKGFVLTGPAGFLPRFGFILTNPVYFGVQKLRDRLFMAGADYFMPNAVINFRCPAKVSKMPWLKPAGYGI